MDIYLTLRIVAWVFFWTGMLDVVLVSLLQIFNREEYDRQAVRAAERGTPYRMGVTLCISWVMLFALLCYDKF